jgi:uncharacterized membrane protein YphA (DoxX/SURF4 family)
VYLSFGGIGETFLKMNLSLLLTLFSSASFIIYGASYFFTPHMKNEFKRFGLEKFGVLTAILEIVGAVGLLVGLFSTPILLISSGGLALLMFFGLLARVRVKDSLRVSLPAILFMISNTYVFYTNLA